MSRFVLAVAPRPTMISLVSSLPLVAKMDLDWSR